MMTRGLGAQSLQTGKPSEPTKPAAATMPPKVAATMTALKQLSEYARKSA
jgi:hypothetical protein